MIQQFFTPQDVEAILSIPLSSRLPRERLVWAYTPKGIFSVKSAYKLARYLCANAIDSEASNAQNSKLFLKVNLETQCKGHIFL